MIDIKIEGLDKLSFDIPISCPKCKKKFTLKEKDIKNAKLYIVCIDKGVGMGQLKECAANNGEFTPKKTEVEQLGDMLKIFGGMK